MTEASIPVDLLNPGQVFACLGFLEAADMLLGNAEGAFDWTNEIDVRFVLTAAGVRNPFEGVLEFLAEAKPKRVVPVGYKDPPPKATKGSIDKDDREEHEDEDELEPADQFDNLSMTFPAKKAERMALPIELGGGNLPLIELGHWADGSGRNDFKLYSGNRSAQGIARAMLQGVRKKTASAKGSESRSDTVEKKGVAQLWQQERSKLIRSPFDVTTPMGGSFNFDPRGAWTPIDAGYSPNRHKHAVNASPVVEFLAAWGLENARPIQSRERKCRYAAWGVKVPPMLARAALCGAVSTVPLRSFTFGLHSSGKNSIVTFAQEEPAA